ncbi:PEP-CTERM sorting domain-containing protein [Colwellia sp. MB02u-18]|uniref:PEP-CTERM sorting domain-containing protein n=1 Tax=unclassified Colwellia TaxID=196834 RepID=UPI0015F54B80|nr:MULTISPECIES: PEP-CTERM sorting domain-containing protein [unclassified Colwellia]MBA6225840.1 PEP-CTERM sorting domain-containing protein [Colwellia sp. MB3u-45]MBA6267076.1 PEP-CTERM sorting domain-containing protein [Colwellia sp. MB3u-43]MBA6322000.1 PEP-CTERM sorting domain-containing protein [Colwellia sp. MB02u-19]MBA6325230.1 PEP-CTERM sorting domain-containing protein [Colwellia sp. MB02u-18]MBA6330249.1 PEP-CTERM sorting domain-containing protein [Colwellia sp. MB02u-12]
MLNLSKKILMTTILTLGMASYSYADIVLDDFDYTPQPDIDIVVNQGSPFDTTQRNNINGFGGDVVYELTYGGGAANTDSSTVTFSPGQMALSNDATMLSTLLITYSEIFAPGNATIDFSSFNGFYYNLVSSDLGFSIVVTIGSGGGTNTSTFSRVSSAVSNLPGEFTRTNVLFSSFVAGLGGGADFTAVDYVSMSLTSDLEAVDLVFQELGVTNVPEPTSLAIFGLGLMGLAFSARKKV